MEPDGSGGTERPPPQPGADDHAGPAAGAVTGAAGALTGAAATDWHPGIPSIREYLPSLLFGAALPIGVYFVVRRHVASDTQALIIAGCFSVAWILIQFIRQRTADVVGLAVLTGFAVGVVTSTLLGGNAYVLKVRDGFFTLLVGVACIVTLYTHDRPAFFYVNRYLSAGTDPAKVSVFDELHEVPIGRHTFRTLSVVWGIGLVVDAGTRLILAELLPTGTFLAVSPFITGGVLGSLFAFTVVYTKRTEIWSMSPGQRSGGEGGATPPLPPQPGPG